MALVDFINTVKPLYYGHQRDRTKCPLYRGVRIIEVENLWFLAFLGPNELSVIERCPYYRGFRKERLDFIEGNRERSTPPAFIQIRFLVSPITFFLFQIEYVNMTQFMKKYMIQTLYMDAWDLGTFYIGDQLFLGVSQLGGKSFVIYKWDSGNRYTKDLKHFLCFKCWPSYSNFSRNLESWKDHYLSLACLTGVIFSRVSGKWS